MRNYILLILVSIAVTSCEGWRSASGTIRNAHSNEPMDSVLIRVLTADYEIYSKSNGKFDVNNPFGGCVPKCPDIIIELSKDSFKTRTLTNPTDSVFLMEHQ